MKIIIMQNSGQDKMSEIEREFAKFGEIKDNLSKIRQEIIKSDPTKTKTEILALLAQISQAIKELPYPLDAGLQSELEEIIKKWEEAEKAELEEIQKIRGTYYRELQAKINNEIIKRLEHWRETTINYAIQGRQAFYKVIKSNICKEDLKSTLEVIDKHGSASLEADKAVGALVAKVQAIFSDETRNEEAGILKDAFRVHEPARENLKAVEDELGT